MRLRTSRNRPGPSPSPPRAPLVQLRRAAPGRRAPAPRPRARRVPTGVLVAVAGLLLVTLVTLLAYEDSSGSAPRRIATPAQLYATYCATCHGASGQGAVGPRLAGRVERRIPDAADELELVSDGRGGMPSFASTLTPAEIRKVVEYTRTRLGG